MSVLLWVSMHLALLKLDGCLVIGMGVLLSKASATQMHWSYSQAIHLDLVSFSDQSPDLVGIQLHCKL